MTLHPGPSCLDAAPLARLWTEPWLGSQGATLDWTPTCTLLSTYRHLQDCGRCLGPLFLLPVPGVGDFNFLSFQQSGNPALPPHSNPHRWYRPTAKARPLSLSLKLSQLGLRGLETRLLLRHVCSTFTNSLPIVGEHLSVLPVRSGGSKDQVLIKSVLFPGWTEGGGVGPYTKAWCQNCPWKCRRYLSTSRQVRDLHTSIVSFPMQMTKVAFGTLCQALCSGIPGVRAAAWVDSQVPCQPLDTCT